MKRIIIILLAIIALSFLANYIPKKITLNKMEDIRSDQIKEAERRLENPAYRDESVLPAMKNQMDKFNNLKGSVKGNDAVILEVASDIMQEMILITSQYENADNKASNAFEFGNARTVDDIDESLEMVQQAEKALTKLILAVKNMGPKLKDALIERNVPQSDVESTLRGFYRTANIEKKIELYNLNLSILKETKIVLSMLRKEWGAWEYSNEESAVIFESDKATTEFNDSIGYIGELAQRVEKLQLEILREQSGKIN